jgi:glutamyl-tRNA reductase
MIVTDPALPADLLAGIPYGKTLVSAVGATLVVVIGKTLSARAKMRLLVDLAIPRPKDISKDISQ